MKKSYEKPVLTTEAFDVDDIITASSGNGLPMVGGDNESPINLGDLTNAPGTD